MIAILTWISTIAGAVLILLFLISLIGGLDLDFDIGSTNVDADSGGLGVVKGLLTFTSVSSWVIKVLLMSQKSPAVAIFIGIISGVLAFWLLSYLFKLLLQNEENVNWSMHDALFSKGTVYLRIPPDGSGIINVEINGATRELKAKSNESQEIKTGSGIVIIETQGEYAIVKPDTDQSL